SLLASIVVAWLLAASIARPLARMTYVAEDMALGRFDHEIEARGTDEVARLSAAFNVMVREVARSQRTLRDFVAKVSHDLRTPPVRADARWMERALDNLVDNALKYTPAGGTITIATGPIVMPPGLRNGSALARRGGELAYIAIHNTGSFIPPGDQPRVFERFY